MIPQKRYLKKIKVLPWSDCIDGAAEEGTLCVVSGGLSGEGAGIPEGIPAVFYRDTKAGEDYPAGCRYVLEGEGTFDPDDFDEDYLEGLYRRLRKIPWDILETDRCLLRETCREDLDAFYEIYADPGITRFTEDLMERSEEEIYTDNYRDLIYEIYGHGIWTVILKEAGEIIGRAGLDERAGFDRPELGFVIGEKWQGRGFATEVCEGILKWASEQGLGEVMSITDPENTASVRLLEKLGFSVDSCFDDSHVIYVLKTDDHD